MRAQKELDRYKVENNANLGTLIISTARVFAPSHIYSWNPKLPPLFTQDPHARGSYRGPSCPHCQI